MIDFTESGNLGSSTQTMFSSTPSNSELPSSMSTSKGYTYRCVDLFNITNNGAQ